MNEQNTMLEMLEMLETVDYKCLNLPIPDTVYKYPLETQREIFEYLKNMDEHHSKAYLIAVSHLGTSFNIQKSNGYREWKIKNT
jgi:hypothetical protein